MTPVADWQWWQYVGAAIGILGLSPAPWIAAVLTRRLMPLGAHLERVAELKESHRRETDTIEAQAAETVKTLRSEIERISGERDYERTARATERERADVATAKLGEFASEFGKSTTDLLAGLSSIRNRPDPSSGHA